MAWSTPRTWTTGELVTAAHMNQEVRDNLGAAFPLSVDAWTAYTPTLTQGATVSKTISYAKYQRVGRLIVVQAVLGATSAGTAANPVYIGLPVAAASASSQPAGQGHLNDASTGLLYKGIARIVTTTTVGLIPSATNDNNFLGSAAFTAALASGDEVAFGVIYEAAT